MHGMNEHYSSEAFKRLGRREDAIARWISPARGRMISAIHAQNGHAGIFIFAEQISATERRPNYNRSDRGDEGVYTNVGPRAQSYRLKRA